MNKVEKQGDINFTMDFDGEVIEVNGRKAVVVRNVTVSTVTDPIDGESKEDFNTKLFFTGILTGLNKLCMEHPRGYDDALKDIIDNLYLARKDTNKYLEENGDGL